ncbi:hypothetical protein FCV25MIE_14850 [Fagus crenata]
MMGLRQSSLEFDVGFAPIFTQIPQVLRCMPWPVGVLSSRKEQWVCVNHFKKQMMCFKEAIGDGCASRMADLHRGPDRVNLQRFLFKSNAELRW